jgi:hypothetical protein
MVPLPRDEHISQVDYWPSFVILFTPFILALKITIFLPWQSLTIRPSFPYNALPSETQQLHPEGGIHHQTALIACAVIANNSFSG